MLYNFIEYIKEKTGYAYLNKILLFSALFLILFGFLSFFSASIGFLNKASSEDFFVNFVRMQVIAYIIGFILMLIFYFLNEKFLNRAAPYFFAFSILIGLITFIPGISLAHGGGVRWINIFGFSFQPADIIKFSSLLFYASYLSSYRKLFHTFKYGILYPFLFSVPIIVVFFLQKDLGTLLIIFFVIGFMYIINNTKLIYIISAFVLFSGAVAVYVYLNSYVMDRIRGLHHMSYQTEQSLIAIGSGGLTGRGYGQSVQKFFHLPEPAGDSIFAVVGEEMGFIGVSVICLLFLVLFYVSYKEAGKVKNNFSQNLAYGIIFLYFAQFAINTGSMVDLMPLSGDTLPFFSKGGSAIIMNLIELGILLRILRKDYI